MQTVMMRAERVVRKRRLLNASRVEVVVDVGSSRVDLGNCRVDK